MFRIYDTFSKKRLVTNHITNYQQRVTAMEKEKYLIRYFVLLMLIATLVTCASV